jgi:hypothetical protein
MHNHLYLQTLTNVPRSAYAAEVSELFDLALSDFAVEPSIVSMLNVYKTWIANTLSDTPIKPPQSVQAVAATAIAAHDDDLSSLTLPDFSTAQAAVMSTQ